MAERLRNVVFGMRVCLVSALPGSGWQTAVAKLLRCRRCSSTVYMPMSGTVWRQQKAERESR